MTNQPVQFRTDPPSPLSSRTAQLDCEFGPLRIEWDPRILAPREWTLQQSMWAAELMRDAPDGPLLELCAGAGHIGLLALRMCDRNGVLVDADPVACHWLARNAAHAELTDRVEIRRRAASAALQADELFPFMLIDPPWVPSEDLDLYPDDPPYAIDGGTDGLDVARECLTVAAEHLHPDGAVLLQLGTDAQTLAIADWLSGPHSPDLQVAESRRHGDRGVLVLLRRPRRQP